MELTTASGFHCNSTTDGLFQKGDMLPPHGEDCDILNEPTVFQVWATSFRTSPLPLRCRGK